MTKIGFALAIMMAWTVMFVRVLVEVAVLNIELLQYVWLPISVSGIVALLYCVILHLTQKAVDKQGLEFSNPFDLVSAIKFGLLYAAVLLVARAAQLYFGDPGIYLSSLISGLVDVDAITLSLAQLSRSGDVGMHVAANAIVIATIANTFLKGIMVLIGGAVMLRKAILPGYILVLLTAIGIALLVL